MNIDKKIEEYRPKFPLLGGKKLPVRKWLYLFGISYKAEKRKSYGTKTKRKTNKVG